VAKYGEHIAHLKLTPEKFAAEYHVAVRVTLTKLRGF
jgi:hypothetical protein